MSSQLMAGKRGLIMGLANDKSIAWGIAKACAEAGAELAFSYQGEALKKRVDPLAGQLGSDIVLPCDTADEASIDALLLRSKKNGASSTSSCGHRLSDKSELRGHVDTSRRLPDDHGYLGLFLHRRCKTCGGGDGRVSMLTLTYYGAEQVMPHYNRWVSPRRHLRLR